MFHLKPIAVPRIGVRRLVPLMRGGLGRIVFVIVSSLGN